MSHLYRVRRAAVLAGAALACIAAAPAPALAQAVITDPPPEHHFGIVELRSPGASQYFSVFNQGAAPIVLGTVAVDANLATCAGERCPTLAPDDFKAPSGSDGCSGATLAPGAGCSTLVQFMPTVPGGRIARLVVPVQGQSDVWRALHGTGTVQPLDCVLDWAERQYSDLFPRPTPTLTLEPFHARCSSDAALCLGADTAVATVDRPSLYVYSPTLTPPLQNLGYLSDWAAQAQCR